MKRSTLASLLVVVLALALAAGVFALVHLLTPND